MSKDANEKDNVIIDHPNPSMTNHICTVTIGIATFKRPWMLRYLLLSLGRLLLPPWIHLLGIVVVDNDPAGSQYQQRSHLQSCIRWPLQCVHEPHPGISWARNAIVTHAPPDTDYLAFIDDDEYPHADWLARLIIALETHPQAAVAWGPESFHFLGTPSPLIRFHPHFQVRQLPANAITDWASTANILFRMKVLTSSGVTFDLRFGLSGGEDYHLTRQLSRKGYDLLWVADAQVVAWVPRNRQSLRWLFGRTFRIHNSGTRSDWYLNPSAKTALNLLGHAVYNFGIGMVILCFQGVFNRFRAMAGVDRLIRGCGILSALVGFRYSEYSRPNISDS